MAVGLAAPSELFSIDGIRLASCYSGIRKQPKDDLTLIEISSNAAVAAVFTTNKFQAAPVEIAKSHLASSNTISHLIINAGNANAGTGQQGRDNALHSCQLIAEHTNLKPENILPFSTGVIGEQLSIDKIQNAIPKLISTLNSNNWLAAANAIMTTDTVAKAISKKIKINDKEITVTGIAKGSGMICPNMATMLSFIATDASISQMQLERIHQYLIQESFNSITVDSDTSTNDAAILIATQKVDIGEQDDEILIEAFRPIYLHLAQAIIRDAEGATKFISIHVFHAETSNDARSIAYDIAHSLLVKTAFFASDANWGRILAVIGRSEVSNIDINKVGLFLNDMPLFSNGEIASSFTDKAAMQEMEKSEISIKVDLQIGSEAATIWTSDLSHDYVKINAEYRT